MKIVYNDRVLEVKGDTEIEQVFCYGVNVTDEYNDKEWSEIKSLAKIESVKYRGMTERERQTKIRKENDKSWNETVNSKEHKEAIARIKNVNLDDVHDDNYAKWKARQEVDLPNRKTIRSIRKN
jgi:hypothetical protein